jgi:hypothetical protein
MRDASAQARGQAPDPLSPLETRMKEIAGVQPPDSALCQAATELVERVSEPFLLHHVMRSYVYAEWLGQHRKAAYDREVLYVATVLHDLGLTTIAPVQARFEIEGADAAKELLARHGMSERRLELVWDAIALHTTAEIPLRKSTEVALCATGILWDLRGVPADAGAGGLRERALEVYPRLDLNQALPAALVGLYEKHPGAAASHAVADACELLVPGFRRFRLPDILIDNGA